MNNGMTRGVLKQLAILLAFTAIFISPIIYASYVRGEETNYSHNERGEVLTDSVLSPVSGSLPMSKDNTVEEALFNICGNECVKVFWCESKFDNTAIGKAGEIGMGQFMPSTFNWMSEKYGFRGDIHNWKDQAQLTKLAFDDGLSYHWTCWRKLYARNY